MLFHSRCNRAFVFVCLICPLSRSLKIPADTGGAEDSCLIQASWSLKIPACIELEEQIPSLNESHECIPHEQGFTLTPRQTLKVERSQEEPEILFWHLEKAGGTSIIKYLREHTSHIIHIVDEHSHFKKEFYDTEKNYFRIGAIREPCSYYNSLYHWGNFPWTPWHGWTARHLSQKGLGERFYGGGHDTRKFKDWLEYMNGVQNGKNTGPGKCGLLSMRLWMQVVNTSAMDDINRFYAPHSNGGHECAFMEKCPAPLGDFVSDLPNEFIERCSDELREFDLGKFDCWIRTDHTIQDMGECFEKFKSRGGHLTQEWNPGEAPVENTRPHASCSDMYDQQSQDLVAGIDADLNRLFGFSGVCCDVHPGASMPK